MDPNKMPEQTVLKLMRRLKSRTEEPSSDPKLQNGLVDEGVHRSNGKAGGKSIEPAGNDMHAHGIRGDGNTHAISMRDLTASSASRGSDLRTEVAQIKVALQLLRDEFQEKHATSSERISTLAQDAADVKRRQQEIPLGQGQSQALEHVQAQAPASGHEQTAALAEKISDLARDVAELKRQQQQHWDVVYSEQQIRQQESKEKEEEEAELPLTKEMLKRNTLGYSLDESMWDSCIFVGFPATGTFTSIVIVLGILMTIAMESSFILIVYANFRIHDLTDDVLDGLLHWRAVVAHDIKNYDPASQTSLASRVCMEETSTDRSTLQFKVFRDLNEFRYSAIQEVSSLNGYYLCNLALILWFFAIVHDIIVNVRYTCAVLGHNNKGRVIVQKEEDIYIKSFSPQQVFLVIILVTIPRLAISVSLGYAGIYFLAHTSSLNELLLNAVALVFVLDIDDMLFYALLPQRVKHLTRFVSPLHNHDLGGASTKALKWFNGIAESLWFRLSITGIMLVMCNFWVLLPFNDRLELALHYLCDGNTDFIYTTNQVNDVVFYAEAPGFDYKPAHRMTYQKRAVLEIIGMDQSLFEDKVGNLPDALNYQNSAVKQDVQSLKRAAFGSREYASSTSACIDYTELVALQGFFPGAKAQEYYQSTELLIRDKFESPDFESCSELDFDAYCLSGKSSVARALCAQTCGCDNPWSGQFYAVAVAGCAVSCEPRWQLNLFYETPAHIAKYTDVCEDVSLEVLKEDKSWIRYTVGLSNYLLNIQTKSTVDFFVDQIRNTGCTFLAKLRFFVDLCSPPGNRFRSARSYCPATCMCAVSDMHECPNSCRYSTPHQMMSQGIACPIGLEISSSQECITAADETLNRIMPIFSSPNTVPEGCYVSHGNLIYATGPKNISVPQDYSSLCKSSQPFLPNSISKGNFTIGKYCADCILHSDPCAEECYNN